ncbi:MAG: hypothetical protein RL338_588, partial [Chloroflexota bacterium]
MTPVVGELVGRRVVVEVPATSANLGAGYDCLGLALDVVNRIELEVAARTPGSGTGSGTGTAGGSAGAAGGRAEDGGRAADGGRTESGGPRVTLTVSGEGADELRADPSNR